MAPRAQEMEITSLLEGVEDEGSQKKLGRKLATGGLAVAALMAVGVAGTMHLERSATQTSNVDEVVVLASKKAKKAKGSSDDEDDKPRCSWPLQNCTASACCMKGGQQCYLQNKDTNYGTCMDSCTPGPHATHWEGGAWTCEEVGERTEGESHCSKMGEDCSDTLCCEETNTQCFKKTDGWATCKTSCHPGAPDMADMDGNPWACEKLGAWTQGAQPWVAEQCSPEGQDCRETKCCAVHGQQCFEKSEGWAQCEYDCQPGENPERPWDGEWTCNEIGSRTPGDAAPASGKVGAWVPKTCAWGSDDCLKSRCCISMNQRCFEKNDDFAMCKETCIPGRDLEDNNETWSCTPLGPKSEGLAVKGSPSLFCWSLFQTTSYEMEIMQNQTEGGSGIFQCDEWALLSTDEPTVVGTTPDGIEAKTMQVEWAEITQSVDGTAGNAKLFINCWNKIIEDGHWNNHAWTVKVDPDAVIIPYRLRTHLASHILENVYVVNCNKFPSSPNFPMMYGSLEIYSWKAIQTYANGMGSCMSDMGAMIPKWGEDYFMTHCLDHIGVGRIADFASVGDNVCTGANCGDEWVAAFHPFKSKNDWVNCWNTAHGLPLVPTPPPPENPWR